MDIVVLEIANASIDAVLLYNCMAIIFQLKY